MKEKLSIDKTNWTSVKFGDVVFEPKESSKDPAADGIEHVVGLEHIDSENIHLNRSANLEESTTTFRKRFSVGDVLFGRRRAYLKKAAQASFGGICSGDITVFRAKENLMPELLPFVVNNEKFFDYAVKHSAGGLSPRVKFKDLANYEFLLPPKDQQAQLAELLWGMDEVVEREVVVLEKILLTELSKVKNIFTRNKGINTRETKIGYVDKKWKVLTLQELIDDGTIVSHLDGNHGSLYPKSSEFVNSGIPYISANCIDDDLINFDNAKYLTKERALKIQKGIAIDGDILLAHNATVGPVCRLNTDMEKVILSTTLTYYRADKNKINSMYLFYFMKSRLFQSQLERVMSQSTRNQVPITTQRKLFFIIPPLNLQGEIVKKLVVMADARKVIERKITTSKSLQKSLINQIF